MHLPDTFIQSDLSSATTSYYLYQSISDQTHDLGIASAML